MCGHTLSGPGVVGRASAEPGQRLLGRADFCVTIAASGSQTVWKILIFFSLGLSLCTSLLLKVGQCWGTSGLHYSWEVCSVGVPG